MKKKPVRADDFAGQHSSSDDLFGRFRGRMIAPQTCAAELEISEFTIHRWVRDGKVRAVKLSSRCTRIDGDSLADFMEANTFVIGAKEAQPEQLRKATSDNNAA